MSRNCLQQSARTRKGLMAGSATGLSERGEPAISGPCLVHAVAAGSRRHGTLIVRFIPQRAFIYSWRSISDSSHYNRESELHSPTLSALTRAALGDATSKPLHHRNYCLSSAEQNTTHALLTILLAILARLKGPSSCFRPHNQVHAPWPETPAQIL